MNFLVATGHYDQIKIRHGIPKFLLRSRLILMTRLMELDQHASMLYPGQGFALLSGLPKYDFPLTLRFPYALSFLFLR